MNKVLLMGNLTKDPETRMMSNGKPRTTFTIAVSRPYTDANGQRGADYIMCIAYDRTAELIGKYLSKGRKVLVEAHVRTGSYEKDEGNGEKRRVYTTEFIVDKIEFLSSAREATTQESAGQGSEASDTGREYDGFTPADDEELPF